MRFLLWPFLSLCLLASCTLVEPGGAFNPLRAEARGAIRVKAGGQPRLVVNLGSDPVVRLRDAAGHFAKSASSLPLNGSSNTGVSVNFIHTQQTQFPQGWDFHLDSATLHLSATSSSELNGFDEILTRTRVTIRDVDVSAQLSVPASAAPGVYRLVAVLASDYGPSSTVNLEVTVEK